LKTVTITTDGACVPNPGKGAWAAVLRYGQAVKEIAGFEMMSTNNRMEMVAVAEALEALKSPCNVLVRSDSMIVVNLLNGRGKKPSKRANQDLVQRIIKAMQPHQVQSVWVKGHAGDTDNERCDQLAAALVVQ
jgi:ribonuclease HI